MLQERTSQSNADGTVIILTINCGTCCAGLKARCAISAGHLQGKLLKQALPNTGGETGALGDLVSEVRSAHRAICAQ